MKLDQQDFVTLNDIAKELDINKSKLNYYAWMQLITPSRVMGKTMIFERGKVINRIKEINKYKKQGKKLSEIKLIIDKA